MTPYFNYYLSNDIQTIDASLAGGLLVVLTLLLLTGIRSSFGDVRDPRVRAYTRAIRVVLGPLYVIFFVNAFVQLALLIF